MSWLKQIYRFLNPKFQNAFLDYKVNLKPRYVDVPHKILFDIISQKDENYASILNTLLEFEKDFVTIRDKKNELDANQPAWNNGFLPGLDMMALFTMISKFKPGKYVEVGSGNSTKIVYKAKKLHSPNTKIISIDPMPRTEIDGLVDKIYRIPFENSSIELCASLDAGDILFIDNSHRILPNSDSMVFFMEVLPILKPGVIVHIHDIYLPYDYPQLMCDRLYNEQYGLACYLLSNPERYNILLPCFYISQQSKLSVILDGLWQSLESHNVEKHGGSFWFSIA